MTIMSIMSTTMSGKKKERHNYITKNCLKYVVKKKLFTVLYSTVQSYDDFEFKLGCCLNVEHK